MTVFVVMGVSGSGKITVGQAAAQKIGIPFIEGDDFHPPHNVALMRAGTALGYAERKPWIAAIGSRVRDQPGDVLLACSALYPLVREWLEDACACPIVFIHLDGEADLIARRLTDRADHFFDASLLQSQFDALELDPGIHRVAIAQPLPDIIDAVVALIMSHERPE